MNHVDTFSPGTLVRDRKTLDVYKVLNRFGKRSQWGNDVYEIENVSTKALTLKSEAELEVVNLFDNHTVYGAEGQIIATNRDTTKCECGAAKLGFGEPGNHHSSWCQLFRRTND